MIEILLVILIFTITMTVFPFCFYKALTTESPTDVRWLVATIGTLALICALGMTGTLVYGS